MNDLNVGSRPRPWGYWATFGWALLTTLLSAMIAVIATFWRRPDILSEPTDLKDDGPLLCVGTIAWVAFQISALAFVARLAHWPPGEYLGLIRPSRCDAALALVFLFLFLPGFDAVTYVLGRDIVTPFQVATYLSARSSRRAAIALVHVRGRRADRRRNHVPRVSLSRLGSIATRRRARRGGHIGTLDCYAYPVRLVWALAGLHDGIVVRMGALAKRIGGTDHPYARDCQFMGDDGDRCDNARATLRRCLPRCMRTQLARLRHSQDRAWTSAFGARAVLQRKSPQCRF
jgi:hypothetical protein